MKFSKDMQTIKRLKKIINYTIILAIQLIFSLIMEYKGDLLSSPILFWNYYQSKVTGSSLPDDVGGEKLLALRGVNIFHGLASVTWWPNLPMHDCMHFETMCFISVHSSIAIAIIYKWQLF